jgi:DNA polymerase III gamma/tau subunit
MLPLQPQAHQQQQHQRVPAQQLVTPANQTFYSNLTYPSSQTQPQLQHQQEFAHNITILQTHAQQQQQQQQQQRAQPVRQPSQLAQLQHPLHQQPAATNMYPHIAPQPQQQQVESSRQPNSDEINRQQFHEAQQKLLQKLQPLQQQQQQHQQQQQPPLTQQDFSSIPLDFTASMESFSLPSGLLSSGWLNSSFMGGELAANFFQEECAPGATNSMNTTTATSANGANAMDAAGKQKVCD